MQSHITLLRRIRAPAILALANLSLDAPFTEADLYPNTGPLVHQMTKEPLAWYSPFFCPLGLTHNSRPSDCDSKLQQRTLIVLTWHWLTSLSPTTDLDARTTRTCLEASLAVLSPKRSKYPSESDQIYTCCSYTTQLLLAAEAQRCGLRAAATRDPAVLNALEDVIKRTNIYGLWGDKVGLLFWVSIVAWTAAPPDHFFRRAFNLFLALFSSSIVAQDCHIAVAMRPLQMCAEFGERCRENDNEMAF